MVLWRCEYGDMECVVSMEPIEAGYTPAMTMGDCKSVGKVVALVISRARFALASSVSGG